MNQWWLRELKKTIPLDVFVLSSIFIYSLYYLLCKLIMKNPHKLNLPPSPPKLPIVGNLHQIGKLPHRSLAHLSKKYGDVMIVHFGRVPALVVSSAEMVSEIVKTNDVVFSDRPQTEGLYELSNGFRDIVFCPYGDYWREIRRISVSELLNMKKVHAFEFVREEIVASTVDKIRCCCRDEKVMDVSLMFGAMSEQIITKAAFGRVYDEEDGGESFVEIVKKAVDIVGASWFEDVFPLLGWINVFTGTRDKVKTNSKNLYDFVERVINEHQDSEDRKPERKDFVDILLDYQKDNKNFSRESIKAVIMDMFVAGTETTSLTLTWAMTELVKKPSTMKKVQEEIRRVVRDKSKVDQEADINHMNYLKCVIKETMRLHVSTAFNPRSTTTRCKLGGYDIPAKIKVMINVWAIQRDPRFWEDAEEFIPERFERSVVEFKDPTHNYMPYGYGRRTCPDMSFGNATIEVILANLLCWFDWKMPDGLRGEDVDVSELFAIGARKKIPLCLVPVIHKLF